jgi:hypothetical protein
LLVRIPLSFCCFYVGAREPVFLNINVYSEFSLSDQEVGCMMNAGISPLQKNGPEWTGSLFNIQYT